MKTLFDVLEGMLDSDYEQYLDFEFVEFVIIYARVIGIEINTDLANSIIRVAKLWIDQMENGNGEWSRMREEAKADLTCYLQTVSGHVATAEMWKSDFYSMDVESWYGLPNEECIDLHWLNDMPSLVEVEFDSAKQEWVNV